MTKNALKFLNILNELSGKMAKDTKDNFFFEFMEYATDKAGKSLGYNEVKELQWKVIATGFSYILVT